MQIAKYNPTPVAFTTVASRYFVLVVYTTASTVHITASSSTAAEAKSSVANPADWMDLL